MGRRVVHTKLPNRWFNSVQERHVENRALKIYRRSHRLGTSLRLFWRTMPLPARALRIGRATRLWGRR